MPISTSPACPTPSVRRRSLEELAWLVPGQAQPDNLAPLLRDHVLPALARRAAENPETQAEHRTRPDHVR